MLLVKLCNEVHDKKINYIARAPHWKTLKQYGGWMDIVEYRDGFDKIDYAEHGIVREASMKLASVGWLYEKRLKF